MYARHRNTGNGYRSGSMGMGLSASRISAEGSMRGHGFYGSEHRSFKRGFGHGQENPKSHQPPPPFPPPQQLKVGDIFVEAGRLAAEYLVSQGVLPPSALSGKWQNANLKTQHGEFQEFKAQEGGMGSSGSDVRRRRYLNDYSPIGSRSHMKGRRKGGFYRYGSDFGREYGRSGSWSDRMKASHEIAADDDSVSGHREEQPVAEDIASSLHRSTSSEFGRKREGAGDSESLFEKYSNLQDGTQSKTGSSSAGKEIVHDGGISKMSEASSSLKAGTGELKDGTASGGETDNQIAMEGSSIHYCDQVDEKSAKSSVDLLSLCKFANVPTKTRSSLTMKGSKIGSRKNIEGSTQSVGLSNGTEIPGRCDSPGHSSGKTHKPECPSNESSKSVQPAEHVGDLGPAHDVEKGKCHRSQSFTDRTLRVNIEKESGLGLQDLHRSYSVGKERGEKRVPEYNDMGEKSKRQREWLPSQASTANESFSNSNTSENKAGPDEKTSSMGEKVMMAVDDDGMVNKSNSSRGKEGKSSAGYKEERQLFPSSFKICDLNLVGASDSNENNLSDPMLIFPAISEIKKEWRAVEFNLSMSSSSKSLEYATRISNDQEIEMIDLENDSPEEVKANDNLDRKQDAAFMGFSHQPQNACGISDVPDYNEGLMMVEFLDSFGNIPPINPGINPASQGISQIPQDVKPMQNEIELQTTEGTLGADHETHTDDDSIFMSLGEIPLTFLHVWDQPPGRGYEKPF